MNKERKIVLGTAEIQVADEALGKGISRCCFCGKLCNEDSEHLIFRAPSRVNGVHMHRQCAYNHKGAEEVGSNSKGMNFQISYSINKTEEEAIEYATFSCDHTTKDNGFMVKVTSPLYTSNQAFIKHFNGLVAYDLNRKCQLKIGSRTYETRVADVVEVVKIAQNIARLEADRPNKWKEKVEKLLKEI